MGNIIADLRYCETEVLCGRSAGSSGIPEDPVATESTPTHGRVVVSLIVDDCCPLPAGRPGRTGRRTEDHAVGLRARSSPGDVADVDAAPQSLSLIHI